MTTLIRPAGPLDTARVAEIYHDAVNHGTAPHYRLAQARAWAPSRRPVPGLARSLANGRAWIAGPGARGLLLARADGYLDLFFVRPAERGGPVARALYATYAAWLDHAAIAHPTAHASHLLRPFLERRGWSVTARETAIRRGQRLDRFAMRLM